MLNKVKEAVVRYNMLSFGDDVTVALSGGADSVALLKALNEIKEEYNLTLSAIHINHNLRGEESLRDEEFCKHLCKQLNIPLEVCSVSLADKSEKTARQARYEIFSSICGKIATAHTLGDNLETVIFNITRGAGVKGARGIPPVRDNIIRPLILCSREETEAYAKQFVTDSSNLTDDYSRNLIRHKVTPVLKSINPMVETSILRMSDNMREIADFIYYQAEYMLPVIRKGKGYDVKLFLNMPPALQKAVSELIIKCETLKTPDSFHIEKLTEIFKTGARLSLDGGYTASVNKGVLTIGLNNPTQKIQIKTEKSQFVNNLLTTSLIDCDKIKGELVCRFRLPSDSIKPVGRPKKTLKKLFNELAIPKTEREVYPILADEKGVVFVPGVGVDMRVRADENSKEVLKVTVTENDK